MAAPFGDCLRAAFAKVLAFSWLKRTVFLFVNPAGVPRHHPNVALGGALLPEY